MFTLWTNRWLFLVLASVCQLEGSQDDPAARQLPEYAEKHASQKVCLALDGGQPLENATASMTVGPRGLMLMQDYLFIDTLSRFDRERIPERVVHAKGSGAHGYFEVTHDITKYTKAKVFEKIGKRTVIAVRFSSVTGEHGSAETMRDVRGFAVKFYTDDGIWDLVGNNTPLFFIRDPIMFPSFVHILKRNPQTNLHDANMYWDFMTLRPETIHQLMILFSDLGIPDGFRHMHGFGTNTFKMVNKENTPFYVKFHYKTDQGIMNLTPERAANLTATDPDYATRDLFNAIHRKEFPSWTFYIQAMTYEQAEKFRWNPFDVTKTWPEKEFPLIPVGKIVLNRNPINYFAEVEQMALSVSNLVPGIEPSPDPVLQGRIFSYSDAQRYRLGTNHLQLPINSPRGVVDNRNYNRDGTQLFYSQGAAPNYYPNSFSDDEPIICAATSEFKLTGDVKRYDKGNEDNFSQPAIMWNKELTEDERKRLVENIANSVKNAIPVIQERTVKLCNEVSPRFGEMLAKKLGIEPTFLAKNKTPQNCHKKY